jgi:excisionase family DNA binding protein
MQMDELRPQSARPRFWRVGQLARRTGLHRNTISNYLADGTISTEGSFKTAGGKWRIANTAVEAFLHRLRLVA